MRNNFKETQYTMWDVIKARLCVYDIFRFKVFALWQFFTMDKKKFVEKFHFPAFHRCLWFTPKNLFCHFSFSFKRSFSFQHFPIFFAFFILLRAFFRENYLYSLLDWWSFSLAEGVKIKNLMIVKFIAVK